MGQVTLYLDNHTERKLKAAVKGCGLSQSKWLSELIQKELATEWPDSIRQLAGTWDDFPSLEEVRSSIVKDSRREIL
jgi:hypothetical protein